MADTNLKPVRWIRAFLGVITKAIYEPKRIEQQYRGPTPPRRPTRVKGWRDTVGGAGWMKAENKKAHAKWLKRVKAERARKAAYDAAYHEFGIGQRAQHRSERTMRREIRRHA